MLSRKERNHVCVREAEEGDKPKLANLIHFETYVHRHLDWRTPLDWVGYQPFLISEQNGQMVGAIACPPDPPTTAWIRLFAMSSLISLSEGWDGLWGATKEKLLQNDSIKILAIPLQDWFKSLLKRSNFIHIRDVVILVWEGDVQLSPPKNSISIRPMKLNDIPAIHEIDNSAFEDEWQNSIEAVEASFRQASLSTVAVHREKILGYQISTGGAQGGHLARLAVRPNEQKKGIGYALVYDLLTQFNRRGVSRVTVNTQQDNFASLKLYEKANFRTTGEIFPVYQYSRG